jgi:hypothetical protein
MQIHFERTGGFAGLRMTCTLDTSALPPEEVQALQAELKAADFFKLPAEVENPGQADRFTYQIGVKEAGKQHTIRVGETSMPASLHPLVEHLTTLARSNRFPPK